MQKIKIFLAASIELEDDIVRLGDAIRYKNNQLAAKGIYFELKTWRDHTSRMVKEGLQQEYNESVREGDIFFLLAHSKVGEFTETEFDNAYDSFTQLGAPFIFTYFKDPADYTTESSLTAFREKLIGLNHYLPSYIDFNDLWNKIHKELDLLLEQNPFFSLLANSDLFNCSLTRRVMEAMGRINPEVNEKLDRLAKANVRWETDKRYSDGAKGFVTDSFMGMLSSQIGKLMAIGKSVDSGPKAETYVKQCHQIAKIGLQVTLFSLLTRLWSLLSSGFSLDKPFSEQETTQLKMLFEGEEADSYLLFQLVGLLLSSYHNNHIDLPIPELAEVGADFQSGSALETAINELHKLSFQKAATYTDCFKAEKQLGLVLEKLIFYTQYKMISIKTVNFETVYERSEGFFHNIVKVGSKASQTTLDETLNYHQTPIPNHAVLLFKDSYTDESQRINLYPFIVDMYSLFCEPGNKVCLFSQKLGIQNILSYRFAETNEPLEIAYRNLIPVNHVDNLPEEVNKLIVDKSQRIQLNLDNTVRLFAHAAKHLAGVHFDLESEDLFSF